MKKTELEHLLRAAGAVVRDQHFVVGSRTKNTGGVTGWCVEIHDLAISKLAAGREKDLTYIRALLKHKLVKRTILEQRIPIRKSSRTIGPNCWKCCAA